MSHPAILRTTKLGFVWETQDPFLFCVHHDDAYPKGNDQMGPAASLAGRNIGMDFEPKDGWRMYHGDVVPGFPSHPHRGFETITIVRRGFVDHCDSLGAAGRYGNGDVQWMTAGRGIVHSEMFPLVKKDADNHCELFQIWLNLPKKHKFAEPHFAMLWADDIPKKTKDGVELALIAGKLEGLGTPPPPPPKSWASEKDAGVTIWTAKMDPGAKITLPVGPATSNRTLYHFAGGPLKVEDRPVGPPTGVSLRADAKVTVENTSKNLSEFIVLEARPIQEPVVKHGPFVMNSREEIVQAFADYQRTQFGGWPWKSNDPVHEREKGRFARYPDGKITKPA